MYILYKPSVLHRVTHFSLSHQVSVPLKRKLEDENIDCSTPKRRSLEPANDGPPTQDELTMAEKLRTNQEASADDNTLKKGCQQPLASLYLELAEDGRPACAKDDGLASGIKPETGAMAIELRCMQELVEGPHFDSILAKTLLAARSLTSDEEKDAGQQLNSSRDNSLKSNSSPSNRSPRVVVEHQPVLPPIYELGQMLTMRGGHFDDDNGNADDLDEEGDEEEEEDVIDSESDEEEEDEEDSSMFDTPPKHQFDRFWPAAPAAAVTSSAVVVGPSSPSVVSSSTLLTPPASPPQSTAAMTSSKTTTTATYQFLDQTSQRIECDENGKSYLQLGTVSHHHHLPVTPVIQPKPVLNFSSHQRRGAPALRGLCRPMLPRPPNPTPPCDHHHHLQHGGASFLRRQRRCSPCYRQQRSDMLSLSLHKLHAARQRSDSSLRRSVLICNMLRYIEEESTLEQREEQEAAAQQHLSFHHHHHHSGHHHGHQDQEQQQQQSYWSGLANFVPPPTPNPYREASVSAGCEVNTNNTAGGFDAPLKDFNSAFRQSPSSLPPASANSTAASQQPESGDEERNGINWSSVLSLSSQAELDPLNNNTYTESHHHQIQQGLWPGTLTPTGDMTDMDLSHHSFDDISWKLSPISADEVLKAFPEENLFQCAA